MAKAKVKEFEGEEFQFPDEEIVDMEAGAVVEEVEEDDIDVEVEDDTPEEDRGRDPLPAEIVKDLDEDELEEYSTKVKTRLSQMKKVWHDERRAKESAAREREEAVSLAQKIITENRQLRNTITTGETAYIEALKSSAERELELAKREYRDSYDAGDTDKIVSAQERLTNAQLQAQRVHSYQPQYTQHKESALQEQQNSVNSSIQPQVAKPDAKALSWQERNPWFGTDRVMTSLAWGLHEDLVTSGIDPRSDDYYRRIDSTMRKRFPEHFGSETQDEVKPAPRAKATVVASATRSTAPKKVVLNTSQQNLAKKLGLTPKQYALELIKLENI